MIDFQSHVTGPDLGRQERFWKEELDGELPGLDALLDYPRPPIPSYFRATESLRLEQTVVDKVDWLAERARTTPFVVMLAALIAVDHRHTSGEDIIIGSLARFTSKDGVDVVNPVTLRIPLHGVLTGAGLVSRVKETVQRVANHSTLPFERVLRLHERSMADATAFLQQIFIPLNTASELARQPLRREALDKAAAHLATADFVMVAKPGARGELEITCEYDEMLFAPEKIQRFLHRWSIQLQALVSDPDKLLGLYSLLTAEERRQLLIEWNRTERPLPHFQTFPELFTDRVRETPHAVAAQCADECITYLDLNRRANRMAHMLMEHGVGPEKLVALLGNRSIDFLATILAIFKTGGAYLPLDTHDPPQRLAHIIRQSHPLLILAEPDFETVMAEALATLTAEQRPTVLNLKQSVMTSGLEDDPPTRGHSDHLAYVIFTSGSTGLPKGAMIEQRGMINHLYAKIDDLSLTSHDIVAQTASQCFDISVWQFLAALVVGGRVHIYPDDIAHNPTRLLTTITDERVSILETVPSFLRILIEEASQKNLARAPALRWLIPTGEALPPSLCQLWFDHFPTIPLMNAYGPTECSDDVTHFVLSVPLPADSTTVPIGRPINNMRMYILNERLQLALPGVPGELFIGGIGVGRGYLRDPARTATSFIPDPFGERPGGRLYRTGDVTRYLPDGTIEFLGRTDHQVKIHGFRIELAEIEATVHKQSGVRDAVIIHDRDERGDSRLIAYVVPESATTLTVESLRASLAQHLPRYMIPSLFIFLEQLPLTRNGKIDRRRLPAVTSQAQSTETPFVSARTPLEVILVNLWRELLGQEEISIHDNFFELGGSSLLAGQIISRLDAQFAVTLTLEQFFQAPTIAELALELAAAMMSAQNQDTVHQFLQDLIGEPDYDTRAEEAEEAAS